MGKSPTEKGRPSTKTPRRELSDLFEEQVHGMGMEQGKQEIQVGEKTWPDQKYRNISQKEIIN